MWGNGRAMHGADATQTEGASSMTGKALLGKHHRTRLYSVARGCRRLTATGNRPNSALGGI